MGERLGFSTRAVWSGSDPSKYRAWDLIPPISVSTTYKQVTPGQFKIHDYSRNGNPTRDVLEEAMAQLENGERGFVYSTGLAGISAVFHLLNSGDHILSSDDLYLGTMNLLEQIMSRMGIETTYEDCTDAKQFTSLLRPTTRLVFLEVVTNPKLKIPNIREIMNVVRNYNSEILIVVDNTYLTPFFMRPLDLGADIVVMSLGKYMGGHHDVMMGSVVVRTKDLAERLLPIQKLLGGTPAPSECYMMLRSIWTLPLRMEKHQKNSLEVAKFLQADSRVVRIEHPLLDTHAQHDLAISQNGGHSGIIYCELAGSKETVHKFVMSLKVIVLATSFGGTMSTVALPKSMINGGLDLTLFEQQNVPEQALRFSVGLENIEDLLADITQAFETAYGPSKQ